MYHFIHLAIMLMVVVEMNNVSGLLSNKMKSIHIKLNTKLLAVTELDFSDEEPAKVEEPIKTYGYEGNFKVGDKVRVIKDIRIWSVKGYTKEGFICKNFEGVVNSLVLFGRKHKTLCSAITPVKVEFYPDGGCIPPDMFDKKWMAHFDHTELELIEAANSTS